MDAPPATEERMMTSNLHSLRRTNPKGQDFVGVCVLCGKENLTFSDMNSECENVRGIGQDDALFEALNEKVSG